jgi:calcium permeable stress-gated cation channel
MAFFYSSLSLLIIDNLCLVMLCCPCRKFIKAFIQGFLPGIALKIFLILLPTILMIMSKFEGYMSISSLERKSADKYYIFNFVNVFLGSIIAGTAFQQLNAFIHQSANE